MSQTSRRALARAVADKLSVDGADSRRIMRELAAYLVEHNMTDDADVIINDIAQELYARTGHLVVEVTSAHPLDDTTRQRIIGFFRDKTNATSVELHESINQELIGGFIAKTPSAELDTSVRSRLRQLTAAI